MSASKNNFPLDAKRVRILIIGILVMFIGFFIMTLDKEPFGMGFLGITLGPLVVFLGLVIPFFALFYPKK